MKINEFYSRWRSLDFVRGTYQRIDSEHPLDFYIGKDAENLKELVLVTEYEPSKMKSSKSVEVVKGKRIDGSWAVQIKLINPEHEDVFIHLCWDLIESSRGVSNKLQGLETVISRFVKWQKLMEYGSGGLTDEVIKGIVGELTYAKNVLMNKYDPDAIVSSWLGPDGSDRDFVFEKTWTEVKAISTGKQTVSISSIEQLDTSEEGLLAVVTIDETSPSDQNGFSFASIINDFKSLLNASPEALFRFEEKLVSLGYYDRKDYEEKFFTFGGFRFFKVDSTFPKLTRATIRNEIAKVKYDILLTALVNWEIEVI